jgi:hypothetical protein
MTEAEEVDNEIRKIYPPLNETKIEKVLLPLLNRLFNVPDAKFSEVDIWDSEVRIIWTIPKMSRMKVRYNFKSNNWDIFHKSLYNHEARGFRCYWNDDNFSVSKVGFPYDLVKDEIEILRKKIPNKNNNVVPLIIKQVKEILPNTEITYKYEGFVSGEFRYSVLLKMFGWGHDYELKQKSDTITLQLVNDHEEFILSDPKCFEKVAESFMQLLVKHKERTQKIKRDIIKDAVHSIRKLRKEAKDIEGIIGDLRKKHGL